MAQLILPDYAFFFSDNRLLAAMSLVLVSGEAVSLFMVLSSPSYLRSGALVRVFLNTMSAKPPPLLLHSLYCLLMAWKSDIREASPRAGDGDVAVPGLPLTVLVIEIVAALPFRNWERRRVGDEASLRLP